jgi:hypothetical protein
MDAARILLAFLVALAIVAGFIYFSPRVPERPRAIQTHQSK